MEAEVVKPKKDGVVKFESPPKEVKPIKDEKKASKDQAKADKEDERLKYKKMACRMSDRVLRGQLVSQRNPKEFKEAIEAELKRRKGK